MKEPKVQVGILFEPQIEFVLLNPYRMDGTEVSGKQVVTYDEGKILWNGRRYDELLFEPQHEQTDAFELLDVTIGINFHWERKEDQRFLGALKIIVENGKLTGINVIHVEDYLTSVISSEMSATASLELLKAHAVISRSWLLAQIQKNKEITEAQANYSAFTQTDEELIRWYDREDHRGRQSREKSKTHQEKDQKQKQQRFQPPPSPPQRTKHKQEQSIQKPYMQSRKCQYMAGSRDGVGLHNIITQFLFIPHCQRSKYRQFISFKTQTPV